MRLIRRRAVMLLLAAAVLTLCVYAWPRIDFLIRFEHLGTSASGYEQYRHRRSGIVFVKLPAASFFMGSTLTDTSSRIKDESKHGWDPEFMSGVELALNSETPPHPVRLSSFLIATHEVSQLQWLRIRDKNPSALENPHLPVTNVNWKLSQDFCHDIGLELPTEAQWEYACRAGSTNNYEQLFAQGWHGENVIPTDYGVDPKVQPIGLLGPNAFGLFDMHGNAEEWCLDFFAADFYQTSEASDADPVARSHSEHRVVRGGSVTNPTDQCRCSRRGWIKPHRSFKTVGFRPVYNDLP